MRPFQYSRAATFDDASRASHPAAAFLCGGTSLLDLMKLGVRRPESLIDLAEVSGAAGIDVGPDGLRIGALARMADVAEHPAVRRDYPMLSQSLLLAASPQIRAMASIGGNLLQSTRCSYFRDPSFGACNRRQPGSGCGALDGEHRGHAVLGVSERCIATYPGDLAQALVALGATLEVSDAAGTRSMPVEALHRLPGETPHLETTLGPGELITAVVVPAGPWTRCSLYLKVRDRASYAFALSSAAVGLAVHRGRVEAARIALGGVATIPWRAHAAEAALAGRTLDAVVAQQAADAAFATARGRPHNAFKIELGRQTLIRALMTAAEMDAAEMDAA